MNTFEKINQLIKNKDWNEFENFCSTIDSLGEDRDGNRNCLYFFKQNIFEAIVIAEKYKLIEQYEIIVSLNFSSSSFRKELTKKLLDNNIIKPLKIFESIKTSDSENENYFHLIYMKKEFLDCVSQYYEESKNSTENNKLYDQEFVKTIFSNEAILKNINRDIFNFFLKNSSVESKYYLFNQYCMKDNVDYINLIIEEWKINHNDIGNNLKSEIFIGYEHCLKKIKHPFTNKKCKEDLKIVIESLDNLFLFLELKNKKFESNKKNKHKI